MPILSARGLVKRFGRFTALDGVSFDVEAGEVVTLLGPSGCGKTTTLRIVAGFATPDEGELELDGRLVAAPRRNVYVPPEKRGLGMVFQSYAVWPHMTVLENVAYPLVIRHVDGREIRRRVEETLDVVGLSGFGARPATLLSGGQQQRVALARAIVYSPKLLLLDEPLSNLDAKLRGQMRGELKRLQERLSVTMLFVTHDQIEAMFLASRLVVMDHGHVEQIGPPREVYESPATAFVEDFVGRVVRLPGTLAERHGSDGVIAVDGIASVHARGLDDDLGVGASVVLAARAEDLVLRAVGSGDPRNALRCVVERVVYLGAECEVVLRLGERRCTISVPRAGTPRAEERYELVIPEDKLRVWDVGVPLST